MKRVSASFVLAFAAIFSVAMAAAAAKPSPTAERLERMERTIQAMELRMQVLGISGFSQAFTPDYVSTRTHEASLESQVNRLRARFGVAIAESLPAKGDDEGQIVICPESHTDEEATLAVVAELRAKGFNIFWVREPLGTTCPAQRGHVFVGLPALRQVNMPGDDEETTINATH